MFDYYLGSRVLLAVCFSELVLVAYVYGEQLSKRVCLIEQALYIYL